MSAPTAPARVKEPAPKEEKREPTYRVPPDEEVVAATVKVILREGQVDSQKRLAELVKREMRRRDPKARVGESRIRHLALASGLVGVHVRARHEGTSPKLEECPVCGSALKRTTNRTLTGGTSSTGYKCTRCPWWTGREYRVPNRYAFFPLVERREAGKQLTFRDPRAP